MSAEENAFQRCRKGFYNTSGFDFGRCALLLGDTARWTARATRGGGHQRELTDTITIMKGCAKLLRDISI
jgi:hypothetical protein